MSVDVVSRAQVGALLDLVCVRKSKCGVCGRVVWFVRTTTPQPRLVAVTDDAKNHFNDKCLEPAGTRRPR